MDGGVVIKRAAGAGSEMSDPATPTPRQRRGPESQKRSCGSVSIGGARARLHVGGRAPRRVPVDGALGRGAGDTGLPSPEIPAGTALPAARMRWAFRSAPPAGRELRDPTFGSPDPLGPGEHPARPLRPWPQPRLRPLRPGAAPRPSLRPAPSGPRSPPPYPLPEDKPWSRYAA